MPKPSKQEPDDYCKKFWAVAENALWQGARKALEDHKRAGLPLAIWRDGEVQWVSPEEFERGLRAAERPRAGT